MSMVETMSKINEISRELFEVVPRKRLQKLATKVLLNPAKRAMKKIDNHEALEPLQESVNNFMESFEPETLSMLIVTTALRNGKMEDLSDITKMSDGFEEIKPMINQFVGIIEKHAISIGRIVERIIVLGYEMKKDFASV